MCRMQRSFLSAEDVNIEDEQRLLLSCTWKIYVKMAPLKKEMPLEEGVQLNELKNVFDNFSKTDSLTFINNAAAK